MDRGVITAGEPILGQNAPSRARRLIRAGDVLFSSVRPYLRGHAVVPDELDGAIASTGFTVLRPPREIDADYLLLALMAPGTVQQCMEVMKGAHYPAMKVDDVKGLRISDSGTLKEQREKVEAIWPTLLALRNNRVSLSEQLTQLIDSVKDSEFTLLQQALLLDA